MIDLRIVKYIINRAKVHKFFKCMKKFFLVMCALLLALVCVPVIAQDVGDSEVVGMGFGSFAAMAAIIPFVLEILKKAFPLISSLAVKILSIVIGLLIAIAGWKFNFGFLTGLEWYIALLYGLVAGLGSMGLFDTGIVTFIFGLFGIKEKP